MQHQASLVVAHLSGQTLGLAARSMHPLRDATKGDVPLLCAAQRFVVQRFDGMRASEPDEIQEPIDVDSLNAIPFGRGRYLAAIDAHRVAVHTRLWPMGIRKGSHVLRLGLCIRVGHRHRGHGHRLLRELIRWTRRDSVAQRMQILVRSENEPAVALRRKLGFAEAGRPKDRIWLRSGSCLTTSRWPSSSAMPDPKLDRTCHSLRLTGLTSFRPGRRPPASSTSGLTGDEARALAPVQR